MIRRSSFTWPIILASLMLALIVALLVIWIVAQARSQSWTLLTLGTIFILLVLAGVVIYLVLTLKEINLNRRQANFIDSVTHELKSPIASIKLCLQTLDLRQVPPEQQREFLRYMLEDVQRLDALIDHLLVAARLEHEHPTEINVPAVSLVPLLTGCAEQIRRRYQLQEGQIRLEVKPAVVTGRPQDLEMIFLNLLDNAIKYGGTTPQALVELLPHGQDRVIVRISDNGKGVRYELRSRIFRRFFRGGSELERTTKGTGLGLYIVKSLVRKLNGRIQLHGRGPMQGAAFDVELPGSLEPDMDSSSNASGSAVPNADTRFTSQEAAPQTIGRTHSDEGNNVTL